MQPQIVSITSSGQLTVPKNTAKSKHRQKGAKAVIRIKDNVLVVERG